MHPPSALKNRKGSPVNRKKAVVAANFLHKVATKKDLYSAYTEDDSERSTIVPSTAFPYHFVQETTLDRQLRVGGPPGEGLQVTDGYDNFGYKQSRLVVMKRL